MKIGKKFRFHYYLDRVEGRKVLWMPRKELEGIKPSYAAVELGLKVNPEFLRKLKAKKEKRHHGI